MLKLNSTTWVGKRFIFNDGLYLRLINSDTKMCKYWNVEEERFLTFKEVKIMENQNEKV